MKDYYSYVRPKYPDRPWNLEKLPIGNSVLEIDPSELRKLEPIKFSSKFTDEFNVSVIDGNSFSIPIVGRYIIEYSLNASSGLDGDVKISLIDESGKVIDTSYSYPRTGEVVSVTKKCIVEVDKPTNSYKLINDTKSKLNILSGIVTLAKVE